MTTIYGTADVRFIVRIRHDAPDDVFTRGQDPEWASNLYGPMSKDKIIEHWVFNAVSNGVEDMTRLDGWADCPEGSIVVRIDDATVEQYREKKG